MMRRVLWQSIARAYVSLPTFVLLELTETACQKRVKTLSSFGFNYMQRSKRPTSGSLLLSVVQALCNGEQPGTVQRR